MKKKFNENGLSAATGIVVDRRRLLLSGAFAGAALAMPGLAASAFAEDKSGKKLKVAGIFETPIEEPWVNQIHVALLEAEKKLNIEYTWSESVKSADFGRVMREYAEKGYDLIMGDAFGAERIARRVAASYPHIAFVFGSGIGPADPNFGVFDNWIHEPAYLCGMIAGKMTKTNKIGAVAAMPIPEVNRLVNAFFDGAREVNKKVECKTTFIGSFFDPPKAKEAALAQIDGGVDVIYAERFGVIEAAQEKGIMAISNMSDQHKLAPDTVITGPVWNLYPTVEHVVKLIRGGLFTAQDFGGFSYMSKGGATLAPYHEWADKLPQDVKDMVAKRKAEILDGTFRVPVDESNPDG